MSDEGKALPLPGFERPPPKMAVPPAKPTISKLRAVGRLCDDCVRLIHEQGWLHTPPAGRARWRIRSPDEIAYVCHDHKSQRQERA